MNRLAIYFSLFVGTVLCHAQAPSTFSPVEPRPLPASIAEVPLTESTPLISFRTEQLALRQVEGRWQLWADKQFLKDFGFQERLANEALRLVRDLNFTRFGSIPGATPAFEYWLADEGGVQGGLVVKNVIPFNNKALKAEQINSAWIIRDDKQLLYNFGTQKEAAEQALAVLKKHSFNQLGFVGAPIPAMTYLTVDPYTRPPAARSQPDAKELVNKIAQQGLVLPKLGYVGNKMAIETRKLDVIFQERDWVLVHGKDVLARFPSNHGQAREALRLLQDARVTELVLVGQVGLPIYLCNGKPPQAAALGFNSIRVQPAQMKVQMINGIACLYEGTRILMEFGDKQAEAELVLKVLQHFQFDQMCVVGDLSRGGLRFFVKSK